MDLKGYTIFHTAEWASVLAESYGYRPHYMVAVDDGRIVGVLPLMDIESVISGRRGVSLPFTDRCSPLAEDDRIARELWDAAVDFGVKRRWKHIEIRDGENCFSEKPSVADYRSHRLRVDLTSNEIEKNLRDSTRRNIKKARKWGVTVNRFTDLNAVKTFYHLNCLTRKRHGLPPQPLAFFKAIHRNIILRNKGFILLAGHDGRPIAGALFLCHDKTMVYKYGASAAGFERLRANNALIWKAVSYASDNGYRTFDFGRTESDNHGLLQFKRGWGGQEDIISYYKYDMKKHRFTDAPSKLKTSYHLFQMMPLPLLKLSGRLMYRHAG